MYNGIPADVRWMIEAKVRCAGESSNTFISHMPGTGRSSYANTKKGQKVGSLS